ncbi:MAG: hypothetical protein ACJ8AS_00835 [Hyphomicrobiales bacterium]
MQRISNQALRDYFIGWQCRIRQIAMREYGGEPLPGLRPKVSTKSGETILPAMTVLLIERDSSASTAFLKFQALRHNERQRTFEAGVNFLSAEYYQSPELFSDEMTAVFSKDSGIAAAMLRVREVLLDFSQFSQTFRMFCKVRRLERDDPSHEASLWQTRIFNPDVPNDALVLGFKPDWKSAVSDPFPQL